MADPTSSPDEGAQGSNGPSAGDVRTQLDRLLQSSVFAQSIRMQGFLRFIVEETLAGRGRDLKEYTIALDVFERDESFDPQTSSIVRVEASRLRSKLKEYYGAEGRDEPVRIHLPTGSYVPTFETPTRDVMRDAEPPADAAAPRFVPARAALIAVAVIAVIGVTASLLFGVADRKPGGDAPSAATDRSGSHAIAVLPFRNLSGNPDEDYFSDGMTDMLITNLAKQRSVHVISLTSAMVYKNVNKPIANIARELNVSHVIEGSILRSGERVRITAQLIEAATDRHLWAESYERDVADVLAIQADVARRMLASLRGNVDAVPAAGPKTASTVEPEAQEAYLKGRYFRNQMTEDGFRKAIAYFKQAIAKEPDYPEAHSGMASCYCLLGGHGFELVDPREGMPAAKNAVMDALRLDDTQAEAHAFLGIIRLKYEWDWPGAEEAFRHAIWLNPSYAQGRLFYSFFLEAMGRHGDAIREAEAARRIDPLSLPVNVNLSWQYLRTGRMEQALRQFEKTRELRSDFWGIHWGLGHYHRQKGDYEEAIRAFEKTVAVGGGHTLPITDLGYTYAIAGRPAEALDMLDRLKTMAKKNYVSPYNMATIYVGLGEIDQAFTWLEKAFETRSRSMVWLKVAREYDGVRSDPRFKSLLRRVGLPE